MFRWSVLLPILCALTMTTCEAQVATKAGKRNASPKTHTGPTYDPARNAFEDISQALSQARKTGRRVLVEVGGEWCPWCRSLNQFFTSHPDLEKLRDEQFIAVKVYFGVNKRNEAALARYGKPMGIPHFFVLDQSGSLLHSQHVIELETDGSYDEEKMRAFLQHWH